MEYSVVLIAALCHAIWNSLIKQSGDRLFTLAFIRLVGLLFGLIVITTQAPLMAAAVPYLILAALIHFLYFYLLLNMYKYGDFSQVYPISRGLAPLIVLCLGNVLIGEHLKSSELVGTVLICSGVLLLAFSNSTVNLKPVIVAGATAVTIAGYTFTSGMGVRTAGSFLIFYGWLETIMGLGVVGFTVHKRSAELIRYCQAYYKIGLFAGVLSLFAYGSALWAMSRIPMAPVAALRETSIIFAAIIGTWFMHESFAFYRIAASILVVGGVMYLTGITI